MIEELSPQGLVDLCEGAWMRAYGGSIKVEIVGDRYIVNATGTNRNAERVELSAKEYKRDEFIKLIDELTAK